MIVKKNDHDTSQIHTMTEKWAKDNVVFYNADEGQVDTCRAWNCWRSSVGAGVQDYKTLKCAPVGRFFALTKSDFHRNLGS